MTYEIIKSTFGYYRGGVNSIIRLLKGDKICEVTQTELNDYNKKYKVQYDLPLFILYGTEITKVSLFTLDMKKNNVPKFTKIYIHQVTN